MNKQVQELFDSLRKEYAEAGFTTGDVMKNANIGRHAAQGHLKRLLADGKIRRADVKSKCFDERTRTFPGFVVVK